MKHLITAFLCLSLNSVLSVADVSIRRPPHGELVLFYQDGDKVVVRECENYYPAAARKAMDFQRSDCQTKTGTTDTRVPRETFKDLLKDLLKSSDGFSEDVERKAELYDENLLGITELLMRDKADLEKELRDLKDRLGDCEHDTSTDDEKKEEMDVLNKRIVALQLKIPHLAKAEEATKELNQMISDLVDRKIADIYVTPLDRCKDPVGFESNVLIEYALNMKVANYPEEFYPILTRPFRTGQSFISRHSEEEIKPLQNDDVSTKLDMRFKKISVGSFDMGSNPNEQDRDKDEDQRRVNVGDKIGVNVNGKDILFENFEMMDAEVTQKQWNEVLGYNPSFFKGDSLPVEQVNFNEIQSFISKLNNENADLGHVYRLPTEEEWEYAARGGTSTRFSFGDDPGYSEINQYAWYGSNSKSRTHEVRTKKPNQYGLYDMHGNVWEWTCSIHAGPSFSPVFRGGSWAYDGRSLRSARRLWRTPNGGSYSLGFRLVRTPK